MSNENGNVNAVPNAMLGWLIAPLAVLVALLADQVLCYGLEFEMDKMTPFAVTIIAAALGMAPRVLKDMEIISNSDKSISLVTLVAALTFSEIAAWHTGSNFQGLLFFVTMFGGHALDIRGRHEWNTVLIFSIVGVHTAMSAATYFAETQTAEYLYEGQIIERIQRWQEGFGFILFNTLTTMIVLGFFFAVKCRGVLTPGNDKGWFGYIKPFEGYWNKATMPLDIALLVWAASHMAVQYYYNTLSDVDVLGIWDQSGYHGYIGFWPPVLTGVVSLVCAWMCAERWYTRASVLGSMWILYIVSSLYESGHWYWENLDYSQAAWIWFGITFFIGVVIYWFSTHEKYGGWMIRDLHQPSQARVFWSNHWAGILTFTAFLVALTIRVQWYLVPSMNASGIDSWDLTGGSDPWYMKRVVDYVLAENSHLIWDADRNYPVGGINPRPPVFSWSIAIGAMLLTSLGVESGDAAWWSMLALPAIYGALTVFPMAGIAKDNFGKGAGVLAAWLIAFMPTHVQKSTWGLADHDSYVLLFLTTAFMFYLRAVNAGGDERLSRTTSPTFSGLLSAISKVMSERRSAVLNAIAAGVFFGIVALGWKGFVYGPAIIFLAYFLQVAMNMFRRKDSTILSTLNLVMLATIFMMVLPFYAHPQLDLVLDGTGLQPLLFVGGFTLAITWITTGFRDKPWLLVLGSLVASGAVFFGILYVLKTLEISNAWDVLLTGSGYFTKNKIFTTIAEASEPPRGQLFASYGPIVFVLAVVMGLLALYDGMFKKNQQNRLVLGMWVIVAAYMAWNAGRFLFNAAPAMAVMGSWGIVAIWGASGASGMARSWRKMGIRTPGERITSARKAIWRTPQFSAIFLVLIMIFSQHATYGLDAGMPSSSSAEADLDETIYHIVPDILRWNDIGFSLMDDEPYDNEQTRWYLGSFGSGFSNYGWNQAFDWLAHQDTDESFSDRPAFVSWWDYGFHALTVGEHPTVSDNFQSGIPPSGNMLLARNQDDITAMFIARLSEGDIKYAEMHTGESHLTQSFVGSLNNHLSPEQVAEFAHIATDLTKQDVIDNSFTVIKVNIQPLQKNITLAMGHPIVDGIPDTGAPELYRVYDTQIIIPCEPTDDDLDMCDGDSFRYLDDAEKIFENNIVTSSNTEYIDTHYIIGDYWYTSDLVNEFDSVATKIHRANSRLALITQLLTNSLSSEELHDLYADIIGNDVYAIQDFDGSSGETLTRNNEIRYLAVDNLLYPRGGLYSSDYSGGKPTGIFHAPAKLSGQDFATFMHESYITMRGTSTVEMDVDQFNVEMRQDVLNQQAGATTEPLQLQDVRIDHQAAFFDTMLARTYVGYGASHLGFSSNEQPGQHFRQSGTPGTMMTNAIPLPGAMMNHFVIANWYNSDVNVSGSLDDANTLVKVLKYYPGIEVGGSVEMSDDGQPLPNVRILIERDAFSGEDAEDNDAMTYWIPIGFTDADENGEWSYTVPAGRIRVSAYAGVFNDVDAKSEFRNGNYVEGLNDIAIPTNEDRQTNLITQLLGQVANMTWVGESTNNITGAQADREESFTGSYDIIVDTSGVSGTVTWTGHESFDGQAMDGTNFILRNIWSMTENYTVTTTSGSFTTEPGDSRTIQGTGEVAFDGNGTFDSQGEIAIVKEFTGTYTRTVLDGRSYTANATWTGAGSIVATWIDYDNMPDCAIVDNETQLPTFEENNETITHVACLTSDTDTYLFSGQINATGRMTADGVVQVVKSLDGETFEGAGVFEGEGIVNGTGLFTGEGTFTGPMVEPGSFYKTGLMPGTYNMIAQLPNGRDVLLPNPVEVGVTASYDLDMTMPGAIFEDMLVSDTFTNGDPTPYANTTIEVLDVLQDNVTFANIVTDSEGNFTYGPMPPGMYVWRVDVDEDGWYEIEVPFDVTDTTENVTLTLPVPTRYDLSVTLDAGASGLSMANRTLTFTNSVSTDLNPYVETATSDENGSIDIELDIGEWVISDESDENYVLWSEVEIVDSDLNMNLEYGISVWINGTVWSFDESLLTLPEYDSPLDIPSEFVEPATSVTVEARSGSILIESFATDGNYSLRLPAGKEFHVTVDSFLGGGNVLAAGMFVENASEVVDTDLYLTTTNMVQGMMWLRDAPVNSTGIRWESGVPGAEDVMIIATDETGLQWQKELDTDGNFLLQLTDGNWTLSVSNELMNVSEIEVNATDFSGLVDMVAKPDPITTTFHVFIDVNDDQSWENGTAVSPEFSLQAQDDFAITVNVTSDMYDNITGELVIDLEIGEYLVVMSPDDPSDENASAYHRYLDGAPQMILGLSESGEPVKLIIKPEYLTSGSVTMYDMTPMDNSTVWLRTTDGIDFFPLTTDENGSFSDYVPAGEYYVDINPYQTDSNTTEIFRGTLLVSGANQDISWTTEPVLSVELHLEEGLVGTNVAATRVTAISLDGLGNISLGPSDNSGNISEQLMPGNWTLSVNRTENLERWFLDEGIHNSTNEVENGTWTSELVLDKFVLVGGKIFWDLNDDDIPGVSEGVEGVNVSITGANLDENLLTDENGVWDLFVPIRDNYTVTVSKTGFDTVTYDDGSGFYPVNDTHESRDLEITAGMVAVGGNVTDKIGDIERLENATITLYPASGIIREPVIVNTTSISNGVLTWNAQVQPGNWIVIAEDSRANDDGAAIAVRLLEASVQEGATIDMEMSLGGRLIVSTTWTTWDGQVMNTSAVEGQDVEVEIDLGDGRKWYVTVDEAGQLDLNLPDGEVDLDSEFTTIQHSLSLEMEYNAGLHVDVMQATTLATELNYNRRVNSDLIVNISSVNIGSESVTGDLDNLTAVEKNDLYELIELTLNVAYEGTEINDIFTVTGEVGVAQDSADWVVEFKNETGQWVSEMEMNLGIGDDDSNQINLVDDIEVRITLPPTNTTQTYDDGHIINVRFTSDTGGMTEQSLRVHVPQQYNISISELDDRVGVADGGEKLVTIVVANGGNGDDTVGISAELDSDCDDAGWDVTPEISNITIAAGNERSQSFTIHAATNSTENECTLSFSVDSESDYEIQTGSTSILVAVASLKIETTLIEPYAAVAEANKDGIIRIPVSNSGFLTATDVIVYLEAAEQTATIFEEVQTTISVPAEGMAYAEFEHGEFVPGPHYFTVRIDVIDTPTDNSASDFTEDVSITYSNMAEEGDSDFVMVFVVLLIILVIYSGYKTVAGRTKGSKF
ncbi:MAG: STT3 domain-containing protein [Candidatus Poseidoniaceae archaeon]|jgi:asparagine N-glycosylation enzyme membrane subunit Stt3|nr:STT3 domain-containing protein [Candidatus Poseidoniaceae archaeon]